MKIYSFTHDEDFGNPDEVISMLKSIDMIRDLRSPFHNFYIIKSSETARTLAKAIIKHIPDRRFFISEISTNREGWFAKSIWSFVKEDHDQ